MKRGDIWEVELDPVVGAEMGKTRPCVIIQNDTGNQYSPVTIIAPITGAEDFTKLYPVEVFVEAAEGGLVKDSVVDLGQIRAIDKIRVSQFLGRLSPSTMAKIDDAIKISLQLQ